MIIIMRKYLFGRVVVYLEYNPSIRMERLRKPTKNLSEPGWDINSLLRKTLPIIQPAQVSIQ
jgi:hypothetical protein